MRSVVGLSESRNLGVSHCINVLTLNCNVEENIYSYAYKLYNNTIISQSINMKKCRGR